MRDQPHVEPRVPPASPVPPKYQILSRIGTGGMAEVFLAVMDGATGPTPVVIKRPWPELSRDPEFVEMFLDEAQLSLWLHHPNVVHTYEVGWHDGGHFLAMEYLEGQPLKVVLDRLAPSGGLPLPLALHVVTEVLAGLDYAHGLTGTDGVALGIVHRDVNPHNVFVTYDGHVKLVDFGIAKTTAATHRTRPGVLK